MTNTNHTTLHITNGDSAAGLIKQAGLDGEVLPWRDPMHHGPFAADQSTEQTSDMRARYLTDTDADLQRAQQDFKQRDATLAAYQHYQHCVLWFEHDLLDQLQLLQILSVIKDPAHVSLICINRFDGIVPFRGLGQLSPAQIASLYERRQPVTGAQVAQATALWHLFCQNSPLALLHQIQNEALLFPFLKAALQRHFQEYPWTSDGLTRTERQLLTLINRGTKTPGNLFVENMTLESALYIGDWRTFAHLDELAAGTVPLVTAETGDYAAFRSSGADKKSYYQQPLKLTRAGQQILGGSAGSEALRPRDFWLGGVHIVSDKNNWQWDEPGQTLRH